MRRASYSTRCPSSINCNECLRAFEPTKTPTGWDHLCPRCVLLVDHDCGEHDERPNVACPACPTTVSEVA